MTLTEAVARRDVPALRHGVLHQAAEAVAQAQARYIRSEVLCHTSRRRDTELYAAGSRSRFVAAREGVVCTTKGGLASPRRPWILCRMVATELSLTAELLLLAIDPARGGLLPRHRRRFRKALAAADLADRGGGRRWPWAASRARRGALGELERAEILQPRRPFGRPRLADRAVAARRFDRLCRGLRDEGLSGSRDRELLLLVAWSGVLAKRLSKADRRLAARRLRRLGTAPQQASLVPQAGSIAAVACADLWSAWSGVHDGFGGGGGLGAADLAGGGGGCGGDC